VVIAEPTLHHHGPAFEAVVLPNSDVLLPLPRLSPDADTTFVKAGCQSRFVRKQYFRPLVLCPPSVERCQVHLTISMVWCESRLLRAMLSVSVKSPV